MKNSRVLKIFIILLIFIIISCAVYFAAGTKNYKSEWPSPLRLMTGPAGGNWAMLGEIIADEWKSAGLPLTVNIAGGGVSNILNINAKRGDLGFSVASLLGAAVKGEGDFEGRRTDDVEIMSNLYPQYTYFIMRKDFAEKNKIKSVDDIIEKRPVIRLATLKPGTSTEFVVKALFEKAWGLDYKKIFQVQYESYESGASLLIGNHLDCLAFSIGKVAPIINNIENQIEIVLLPVSQEAINRLAEAYGTTALEIEPGIYEALPPDSEPVKTVGDYTCIVMRKDLPMSLADELKKVLDKMEFSSD